LARTEVENKTAHRIVISFFICFPLLVLLFSLVVKLLIFKHGIVTIVLRKY
jgi:sRNA-binding regulator protein Hfq